MSASSPAPANGVEYGRRRLIILVGVMLAALLQTLDATIVIAGRDGRPMNAGAFTRTSAFGGPDTVDITTQPATNYFENFTAGLIFRSPELAVDTESIMRFAREFDPQPFHLDPQAGAASFFGALVASGWHTAALTMRLLVESGLAIAGGLIGAGGEIKWPAVLRPGDRIHVETEVLATRPLRSRADMGMITMRSRTINQTGAVVQELTANLFVPRRLPAEPRTAPEPAS